MSIQFDNILQRLKEVISEKQNVPKVLHKDIATELGLSADYFAVIKKRGKIPYLSLALFAQKEGLNLNWLLLGSPPKWIKADQKKSA